MKLLTINISNYRSIEKLSLDCSAEDGCSTFGLIGLNEAGKSSILKAVALISGTIPVTPKEFFRKSDPIEIAFEYHFSDNELSQLYDFLIAQSELNFDVDDVGSSRIVVACKYNSSEMKQELSLILANKTTNAQVFFRLPSLPPNFIHQPIFWTAEDRYLISQPIDLTSFAASPESISIPLRNCFLLAGIQNIEQRITSLHGDSTEIEFLINELGEKVTEHIKSVWPDHPIEITFLISNNIIHFHVKDVGAKGKAKTADQRSDGFKQFVSFLLTISAQNRNEELSNAILLLDEPETHLHPLAQEYLLNELKKITNNDRGNIVLFATHSNYLVDKQDLSKNFRVTKKNDVTKMERLDKKVSSYASVTYDVFEIANSDYHNELYGKLQEAYIDEAPEDSKRLALKHFDENYFHIKMGQKKTKPFKGKANEATLSTYIRNCIHHPENGDKFTDQELRQSINLMRK